MKTSLRIEEILSIINRIKIGKKLTKADVDKELTSLGIDSIKFITIIIAIEKKYKIEIPDEMLLMSSLNSVHKIYSLVLELIPHDK